MQIVSRLDHFTFLIDKIYKKNAAIVPLIELFRWRTIALLILLNYFRLVTLITHRSIIESDDTLSLIFSPSPYSSYSIKWCIIFMHIQQAWWVARKRKRNQKANFKAKKIGRFLNCFIGKNRFLFCESKLFHHGIQNRKKIPPIHVKSRKLPFLWSNPF